MGESPLEVNVPDLIASSRNYYHQTEEWSRAHQRELNKFRSAAGRMPGQSKGSLEEYHRDTATNRHHLHNRLTDQWTLMRGFGLSTEHQDHDNGRRLQDTLSTGSPQPDAPADDPGTPPQTTTAPADPVSQITTDDPATGDPQPATPNSDDGTSAPGNNAPHDGSTGGSPGDTAPATTQSAPGETTTTQVGAVMSSAPITPANHPGTTAPGTGSPKSTTAPTQSAPAPRAPVNPLAASLLDPAPAPQPAPPSPFESTPPGQTMPRTPTLAPPTPHERQTGAYSTSKIRRRPKPGARKTEPAQSLNTTAPATIDTTTAPPPLLLEQPDTALAPPPPVTPVTPTEPVAGTQVGAEAAPPRGTGPAA